MSKAQPSRKIFQETAKKAERAQRVECKPLRPNPYVENGRSLVALIRSDERENGVMEALRLLGGMDPATGGLGSGYVLVKPNCNSHDPFPASTHPDTLGLVLAQLEEDGVRREQIVVGDMSGPAWLPTEATMRKNGILKTAEEFKVRVSFFEREEWVHVEPKEASSWTGGFRLSKTAHNASRVISLPCLKTHQFGGVFTLSLKNSVGLINPADRTILHKNPGSRIAEINLAYTADLVLLDGLQCFVSGGPAHGKEAASGMIVAGSDRVAVDAVGVAILKFHQAEGIAKVSLRDHEQLRRATEIGIGNMDLNRIALKASNLTGDEKFDEIVTFIRNQL